MSLKSKHPAGAAGGYRADRVSEGWAQRLRSSCFLHSLWRVRGLPVPRQQILKAMNGMIGDAGKHVCEPRLGINAVELRRLDQRVHNGRAVAAFVVGVCPAPSCRMGHRRQRNLKVGELEQIPEPTGNYLVAPITSSRTAVFVGRLSGKVRAKYSLGDKEIAFKDFGMARIRNALPTFLETLNGYVPGLLLTLVVLEKRIVSLFGPPTKSTGAALTQMLDRK